MELSSLPAVYSRWLFAIAPLPALSSRWIFAVAHLPADTQQRRPGWSAAPPQRPGQSAAPPQRPYQQLRRSAPASNKPHQAEKSTPVWLAIWHTWAGFANSQHRDAAFATPDNICAHSSLLPHWAAAQTDANLSAHLHRLPTPPPYLRRMRLSPGLGAGIRWEIRPSLAWCGVPANHRAHESLF